MVCVCGVRLNLVLESHNFWFQFLCFYLSISTVSWCDTLPKQYKLLLYILCAESKSKHFSPQMNKPCFQETASFNMRTDTSNCLSSIYRPKPEAKKEIHSIVKVTIWMSKYIFQSNTQPFSTRRHSVVGLMTMDMKKKNITSISGCRNTECKYLGNSKGGRQEMEFLWVEHMLSWYILHRRITFSRCAYCGLQNWPHFSSYAKKLLIEYII